MEQKILLCWNYERKNWVAQFEEIFEAGSYVFINFFSKELEKTKSTDEKVYYWNDFSGVDHLIATVNPSKVVFMGLDSPYVFLLNAACKRKGIKTYFLQHGIFHSYKAYLYEEMCMEKIKAEQKQKALPLPANENRIPASRNNSFFLHSFRLRRTGIYIKIIIFLLVRKLKRSTQKALKAVASEALQTDHYIVYTKHLSRIFKERDGVDDRKMLEIGNDEANALIAKIQNQPGYSYASGDYFLFIDEAFSGSDEYLLPPIVEAGAYNVFLQTLAAYAASKNKKLWVKLHPFSYNVSHLAADDNIVYIKDAGIPTLISNACGVFGFSSTLLIPAVYVKSCCIFKLNDFSHIHQALTEMNYCRVLDFYNFKLQDIEFNSELTARQREDFISYFLFKLDDKCNERLKMILQD